MSMSDTLVNSVSGATGQCRCGLYTTKKTSYTYVNPGKTFIASPLSGKEGDGCGFFKWVKDNVSERLTNVVRRMLKRVEEREEEIKMLKNLAEKKESEIQCLNPEIKALKGECDYLQLKSKSYEREVFTLKSKENNYSLLRLWVGIGMRIFLAIILGFVTKRVDSLGMLMLKHE